MRHIHHRFAPTPLAIALMLAFGPAMADKASDLEELARLSSSVSVGVGGWNNDRPQMGIFDGMRDEGGYLLFDADIRKRNDETGTWQTLTIQNLGTDSREINAEFLQQGRQGVTFEYSSTQREAPYTVNTNLMGLGTTVQTVGANIPGNLAPTPNAPSALTGTNVQLGMQRDKLGMGFYKSLQQWLPGLEFKVNFSNEDKEGNRHWGRGGAAEFAVEPIDFTTRQLEAVLNYTGEKVNLSGGYFGSWFENANDLVTSIGTSTYYLTLPFDNQAHQVFVNGAYSFSPTTKGNFKVAYTRATVDEPIPTASVGAITKFNGAPSQFEAEVNTTLVQLGLTARPMPKLNVLASLRYHDVQDETPVYSLVGNNGTGAVSVHGTPLSYTTTSGKLEGAYSLPDNYSVIAGLDYNDQDRTVPMGTVTAGLDTERYVPFRAELEETTYRLQLRKSLSETVNGSLAYLHSDRDGSNFAPGRNAAVDQIAPLHIADRDRDKVRFTADWTPTEALGLQLNVETSKDDYGSSAARPHGVHEGKASLYSLDVTYRLNANWQVSAWYSHDRSEIYQTGRGPSGVGIKDANQEDTGNAVGLNLAGTINPKTKVGVDLSWVREKSSIVQSWDSGAVTQVPDISSTATRIKLYAQYALKKNADLRFDVIHERWKSDDWTWLFSNGNDFQYGTTTDGTTVIVDPRQDATFVGIRYIYKFE